MKGLDNQLFMQCDLYWWCTDYTNYLLAQRIWKGIQTFMGYLKRACLYFLPVFILLEYANPERRGKIRSFSLH